MESYLKMGDPTEVVIMWAEAMRLMLAGLWYAPCHPCPFYFYTFLTLLTHSVGFSLLLFLISLFAFLATKETYSIHTTLDKHFSGNSFI